MILILRKSATANELAQQQGQLWSKLADMIAEALRPVDVIRAGEVGDVL